MKYVDHPKVLFQDIRCVTLAARLVAAESGRGTMAVSSASMFVPYEACNVGFFEALLNSQFANAWYKLRNVNRSVKLSVLAPLPVAWDETKWKRVTDIGREISKIRRFHHRYLASCTLVEEKNLLSAQFPESWTTMLRLKTSLDSEIFDMYGLTLRQRAAVAKLSNVRVF